MKTFRRCMFVLALAATFSMPAIAGETQGPSCVNPGETQTPPGETNAPPCIANLDTGEPSQAAQASDVIGEVETSMAIDTVRFLLEAVW